ncbi:hypothetical protein AEAC466_15085 [Asticcacaulis sp. AC466]|uniref:catalase family protein n=1 Tax=Asticcacaulis sp. AC466 TaxID=1282362 RepID=UPI0003C3FD18|nr:catalase family protein [Asticcacaulis sp. AC466]ESQ82833.1 hypothetical protein AEAC466_15085 [Asticcacaulis sp. AC466]
MDPVIYTPDMEHSIDDEAEINAHLADTLLKISKQTEADGFHGLRSVHAKSHALLVGELEVASDLPPHLAQGLFGHAKTYPVVMRFSTTPGDILPDSVSTPRGLAIKVVGVEGARLPGSEPDVTQDFVMVNGPAFQTSNAKSFLNSLKLLAATTDKAEGAKVALSAVMRGTEKVIETFGGKSTLVRGLGGEPASHPAGETYYTGVPILYGRYIAKLQVAPVSENLTMLADQAIDITHGQTPIRDAMIEHFALYGGEWEVRVQLCTDLDTMPVEDAAKVWPEDQSPYVTVARLRVKSQTAWSEERSQAVDHGMSFSPWHGLAAHRPLGSIMRLRKSAYEASVQFRSVHSGHPVVEPRSFDGLFTDEPASELTDVYYP